MAQLTAVEWLIQQRNKYGLIIMQDLEQAKAMEKEQIKEAYNYGAYHFDQSKYEGMDNYYNLRYGSNNKI